MRLWVAMAVQAPAHAQRLGLVNHLHLVHPPVARHAAHAPPHMRTVVEIHEIRQIVHAGKGVRNLIEGNLIDTRPTR